MARRLLVRSPLRDCFRLRSSSFLRPSFSSSAVDEFNAEMEHFFGAPRERAQSVSARHAAESLNGALIEQQQRLYREEGRAVLSAHGEDGEEASYQPRPSVPPMPPAPPQPAPSAAAPLPVAPAYVIHVHVHVHGRDGPSARGDDTSIARGARDLAAGVGAGAIHIHVHTGALSDDGGSGVQVSTAVPPAAAAGPPAAAVVVTKPLA